MDYPGPGTEFSMTAHALEDFLSALYAFVQRRRSDGHKCVRTSVPKERIPGTGSYLSNGVKNKLFFKKKKKKALN